MIMAEHGIYRSGNLTFRDMGSMKQRHKVGHVVEGHEHQHGHNTFIFEGRYRIQLWRPIVDANGQPRPGEYVTVMDIERGHGAVIWVAEGVRHRFECVKAPGYVLCVYPNLDPVTGEIVQEYNGWLEAYS